MRVVVSPLERREFRNQVQYLMDHDGTVAAQPLKTRVMRFLKETLAPFPRIGLPIKHRDLYVPGTRLIIWYHITKDLIEIARIWHSAQDP